MLREHHKLLTFIRVFLDVSISISSWLISYFIRFKIIGGGQPDLGTFYIKLSPFVALATIYFLYRKGLYGPQRFITWQRELFNTFMASISAFGVIVLFSYFIMNVILSRLTISIFLIISTTLLLIMRIIIRNTIQMFRRKGQNLRYVLVIGLGEKLEEYLSKIEKYKEMGVVVSSIINPIEEGFDISQLLQEQSVDQIVISIPEGYELLETEILKACSNQLIPVVIIANIPYSFIGSNILDFKGIPVLEFNSPSIGFSSRTIKRTVDIFGSLFGLIVLSPIFLILSLLVKFTSKGPIFYGQERMTREGRVFKMWKFRSMKVNAENIGSGWTVKDDPRRTVIGPFLRASSLDELPQLWNVLIGQMSLVGPRPERPIFIDQFKDEIPAYMLRHKMKAGITGWAQINGWRGDTSISRRIECDLYYIKNWSIFLDIKILLLTFIKGFINKNAY
ncbi:exopolysaccharide biosynthesis polyprenyl glycosylphosphotransferase [Thiospirochaeta perfilievii]|uniref:Exopolysaccharide biosynthesis polyprenyl glycosylphosphotransferase n=1 Tax=Thiospirochaeta perfilievii TaxID=252967 RepID=A0A5C1QC43_9SPIO|nr:exopolysaccharide biosynthesis polyprenyl glycosylphosphotransferase [Thiospirochaeta perfilievii]QEN05675.1 exopolysaccharide biosynthesis polyprenyl glycosylphosphotransferase [Thiospirochaeta perfilievii]